MIKSMTGYGRGKVQEDGIDLSIEIKSVNHRYRDIFIKLPRQFAYLEEKCRQKIQDRVFRGKLEVYVNNHGRSFESSEVFVDMDLAQSYVKALKNMQEHHQLKDDISVSLLAKLPDVLKTQPKELDIERMWSLLEPSMEEALHSLTSMRAFEGEKISDFLKTRVDQIQSMMIRIKDRAPMIPLEYEQKLLQRIEDVKIHQTMDPSRLAMEIALFADRSNIDEEIERMNSHIMQFLGLLEDENPVGRKLDFLVQEMNREINTIGSKANDLEVVKFVIELKSEVEKIREQIQNIE